ncbi:MAG TPA: GNAT family N-acetyltransferase [Solirubrobacteraceae bacterium]|nr:GNAT family N-acetyltransferase [Solirubrobacteraceae bacterium]
MGDTATVEVRDAPERERYEITRDGLLAGHLDYLLRRELIALVHTEVDQRYERHGLGTQMIRFALDDARRRGLAVLPFCPFVKAFIERNPEYADLVPADMRGRFDL